VNNLYQVITILRESLPLILDCQPVLLAYLYGSIVSGYATPSSDVDIGLVVNENLSPLAKLTLILSLKLDLEDRFGISNADFRIINDAPPIFCGRVVTSGVLVYSRTESERVNFETMARMQYFDYLPIHQRMQDAFFEDIRKRGLNG
jgi:predicted nucleotidyltransferase